MRMTRLGRAASFKGIVACIALTLLATWGIHWRNTARQHELELQLRKGLRPIEFLPPYRPFSVAGDHQARSKAAAAAAAAAAASSSSSLRRGGGAGDSTPSPSVAGALGRAERQPRRRRYLAFVPLLGLKYSGSDAGDNDDDDSNDEDDQDQEARQRRQRSHYASREVERMCLRAWDAVAAYAAEEAADLEVVGLVEDRAHCDPAWAALGHVTCVALDPVCRHAEFGIMTLDCILRAAWALGHADAEGRPPPDVYILANGDVVFTTTLVDAIGFAYDRFVPPAAGNHVSPSTTTTGFALVGRRMDLNVTLPQSPEDPPLTEESILRPGLAVRLHQALGIDYFAFTADAFPHGFPPYLIGRWRWDNALLLHFLLQPAFATVDGSEVVHALHLGMPASAGSAQHKARAGGRYNDQLAAATTGKAHGLGSIDHTAYVLKEDEAEADRRRVSGSPPGLALVVERRVQPFGQAELAALRLAAAGGAGSDGEEEEEGGLVVLVPVEAEEGAVAAALDWLCWVRRRAKAAHGVLFLAADAADAEALEAALAAMEGGGPANANPAEVIHLDPRRIRLEGGSGGNMQYYRDKRTGRASSPVLALAVGRIVQRLLPLGLTVVVSDPRLRWGQDVVPRLAEDKNCNAAVLLDADHRLALAGVSGGGDSDLLYLLRPSEETRAQWRAVLACMEDRIRHPKRYAEGHSCVRATLLLLPETAEGVSSNSWRGCVLDAGSPSSWVATADVYAAARGLDASVEPWAVLGAADDEEEEDALRLWDDAVGQCRAGLSVAGASEERKARRRGLGGDDGM